MHLLLKLLKIHEATRGNEYRLISLFLTLTHTHTLPNYKLSHQTPEQQNVKNSLKSQHQSTLFKLSNNLNHERNCNMFYITKAVT